MMGERDNSSDKSLQKISKKSPYFTTISPNIILPLRRGDSEANILAKMYNFMKKVEEEETKRYELSKDLEEEKQQEDERRHERLVDVIKKSKEGKGTGESDAKTSILSKILDVVKDTMSYFMRMMKLLGKALKSVMKLPKTIFKLLRSNRLLGRGGAGGVTGALGAAFGAIEMASDVRHGALKSDRDFNRQVLQNTTTNGDYQLVAPGSHKLVNIPLSEAGRNELLGIYDEQDNPEITNTRQNELDNRVYDIFIDAINKKRESGKRLSDVEESERGEIETGSILNPAGARSQENQAYAHRQMAEDMLDRVGETLDVQNWLFEDMLEDQRKEFKKFFFDEEEIIPQTPPKTPETAIRTEVKPEDDVTGVVDVEATESNLDLIRSLWKQRESLTGIITSDENKERLLESMRGDIRAEKTLKNFEKTLKEDIRRLREIPRMMEESDYTSPVGSAIIERNNVNGVSGRTTSSNGNNINPRNDNPSIRRAQSPHIP